MEKVLIYLKKIYIDFLCFLYYNIATEVHYMNKIKNNFVIFTTIISFPSNEIDVNKFYLQTKEVENFIKSLGYEAEKLDMPSIYSFFRSHINIGKIVNSKVIINNSFSDKHREFFFNGIDSRLINSIKESNKFVFPILYGDEVINYSFITSDKQLNKIKNSFYYDSIKNKSYIIDLTKIEDKRIYNDVVSFLESLLVKNRNVDKEILNYKKLGKLFNLSYSIKNKEYGGVIQKFGLDDEFNKIESIYEILFYYINTANNNNLSLNQSEKNKILRK